MKKQKKQAITDRVLGEVQSLAKEPLTIKNLKVLQTFILCRLDTHGRYGYLFQTEEDYHKRFISCDQVDRIAGYVLECNHVKF